MEMRAHTHGSVQLEQISGDFSVFHQNVVLGYLVRRTVGHTKLPPNVQLMTPACSLAAHSTLLGDFKAVAAEKSLGGKIRKLKCMA